MKTQSVDSTLRTQLDGVPPPVVMWRTCLPNVKDWYQISDPLIKGISPWILGIAFWGVGLLVSENERSLNRYSKWCFGKADVGFRYVNFLVSILGCKVVLFKSVELFCLGNGRWVLNYGRSWHIILDINTDIGMHPLTEVTVTTKRPSLIFAVGDYKPGSLFHASFFWGELVWITMFSFKNPFQGRFLLSYHYKGGIKQCFFFVSMVISEWIFRLVTWCGSWCHIMNPLWYSFLQLKDLPSRWPRKIFCPKKRTSGSHEQWRKWRVLEALGWDRQTQTKMGRNTPRFVTLGSQPKPPWLGDPNLNLHGSTRFGLLFVFFMAFCILALLNVPLGLKKDKFWGAEVGGCVKIPLKNWWMGRNLSAIPCWDQTAYVV